MQRKSGEERRRDRRCLAQQPLLSTKGAAETAKARERPLTAGPCSGSKKEAEKKEIEALIAIALDLTWELIPLSLSLQIVMLVL